jgi:hypothetical protein
VSQPYGGGYGYPSPQIVVAVPQKSGGVAVLLELLPGFLFQTFGIGHIYAGNVGIGLAWLFGYWVLTGINFVLCFVFVGFITWPICWLAAMIISPIMAARAVEQANAKLLAGAQGARGW